jgi:uncharacterized protein YndB with AHSA1/START domain
MKFEVVVSRDYPHSIEKVWQGLTNEAAISDWLMPARGFVAEVGCRFEMRCTNEDGEEDTYRCEVLELDPPKRMRWSWVLEGNEALGLTEVEFRLESKGDGTTVTVFHRGDRDKEMLERFKAGWPFKLDKLAERLSLRAH